MTAGGAQRGGAAPVALARCDCYAPERVRAALQSALLPLGGLDWVTPGMRVALKTNLLTGAKPERAVTTHPAVLAALTELLVSRGAQVVVGDSPGGPFTPALLAHASAASGLSLCEAAGARLNRDVSVAQARFDAAVRLRAFRYTAYLDGADAIIDVCKLKTHGMMGMTCAVKNLFGVHGFRVIGKPDLLGLDKGHGNHLEKDLTAKRRYSVYSSFFRKPEECGEGARDWKGRAPVTPLFWKAFQRRAAGRFYRPTGECESASWFSYCA